VGTIADQESDLYRLTTSIASIFLVTHIVLIPLVGFRVPKVEKPKEENKTPEQT
jgi:uncharacterized membrane protein YagU involved in acid resistance